MEERYCRAWLLAQKGFGSKQLQETLDIFGSCLEACRDPLFPRVEALSLKAEAAGPIALALQQGECERYAEQLREADIRVLLAEEEAYPRLLRDIYQPPPLLYALGEELPADRICVAIVGSRRASQYGRKAALQLAEDLADCGICVVSGMAKGIDSCAHRGALNSARGQTFAVVATGLDIVYPPENKELAAQIAERGLILSEQPLGVKPYPQYFPARNRIISGMSLGVLVVEAAARSGSQITVGFALEQGRDVFAIPGSIYAANSQGPHQLIRQGARLVESVDDILEELGLLQDKAAPSGTDAPTAFSLLQEKILSLLEVEAMHLDRLQAESRLPLGTLLAELMQLEAQGIVEALPGRHYGLKRRK